MTSDAETKSCRATVAVDTGDNTAAVDTTEVAPPDVVLIAYDDEDGRGGDDQDPRSPTIPEQGLRCAATRLWTAKEAATNLGRMLATRSRFEPAVGVRSLHEAIADDLMCPAGLATRIGSESSAASATELPLIDTSMSRLDSRARNAFWARRQFSLPTGAVQKAAMRRFADELLDRLTGTTAAGRRWASAASVVAAILVVVLVGGVAVMYVANAGIRMFAKDAFAGRVFADHLYAGAQPSATDLFHEHSAVAKFFGRVLGGVHDTDPHMPSVAANAVRFLTVAAVWAREFLLVGSTVAVPLCSLANDEPIVAILGVAIHLGFMFGVRMPWCLVALAAINIWARPRVAAWYRSHMHATVRCSRQFLVNAVADAAHSLPLVSVGAAASASADRWSAATTKSSSLRGLDTPYDWMLLEAARVGELRASTICEADFAATDGATRRARKRAAAAASKAAGVAVMPSPPPPPGQVLIVRGLAASDEFLSAWRARALAGDRDSRRQRMHYIYIGRNAMAAPVVGFSLAVQRKSSVFGLVAAACAATTAHTAATPRTDETAGTEAPEAVKKRAAAAAAAAEAAAAAAAAMDVTDAAKTIAIGVAAAKEMTDEERACELLVGTVIAPAEATRAPSTEAAVDDTEDVPPSLALLPGLVLRFDGDMVEFLKTASEALRVPMALRAVATASIASAPSVTVVA